MSMCTLFIDVRRLLVLETMYSICRHFFVLCIQTRPQLAEEEILVDEAVVARVVSQIDEDHPICRVHQASGDIEGVHSSSHSPLRSRSATPSSPEVVEQQQLADTENVVPLCHRLARVASSHIVIDQRLVGRLRPSASVRHAGFCLHDRVEHFRHICHRRRQESPIRVPAVLDDGDLHLTTMYKKEKQSKHALIRKTRSSKKNSS